jgi:hypothetical protein
VRTYIFVLSVVVISLPASAGEASLTSPAFKLGAPWSRDAAYCQDPEYIFVYNMSSGFDSEIADDVPDALAGMTVDEMTLWVGEWSAPWQDPTGVAVNFYDAECPPGMDPTHSFMIPWGDWTTVLVYDGLARVYRCTASLPEPVEVVSDMSIGGYVVMTWGHDEPFCGLCATGEWVIAGCGEAYLDASWWGYPRWSPTSLYTGIPHDLAYCLGVTTPVDEAAPAPVASDLRGYPNPFNSNTTVSFTLGEPSPVRLAVYDAAGRHVATLVDGECLVGDHSVEWDGTVGGGRRASAGVYFARLEAAGGTAVVKLVLRR